jgi:ParB/RepB/Spo0J family partition protein
MKNENKLEMAGNLLVECIESAEKNVHCKERKDDITFRGLVESIKANGVIHRIVVRRVSEDNGERYIIIDGHRRFAAAIEAGLKSVPVEIRDVTDKEALQLMVAANVQRIENDPVLEAEVIEMMLGSGYSRESVASAIGKSIGYIARRVRLINLTAAWREFAKRVPCTVDMLEKVAAHEPHLQDRVAVDMEIEDLELEENETRCEWSVFADSFKHGVRNLEDAKFDTAECENCPNNTGCHAFLFDFMTTDSDMAYCQNQPCFQKKHNELIESKIAAINRKGKEVIEVSSKWNVPEYWNAVDRATKTKPQAYVYEQDGLKNLLFSVERTETATGRPQLTPEEKEAQRREKKRKALVKAARSHVREVVNDGFWSDSSPIVFTTDEGRAAFRRIAEARLERELQRPWVPDDLIDDIVHEMRENESLRKVMSEEEFLALTEEISSRRETAAETADETEAEVDVD